MSFSINSIIEKTVTFISSIGSSLAVTTTSKVLMSIGLTFLQIPITSTIIEYNTMISQFLGIVTAIVVIWYWHKKGKHADKESKFTEIQTKLKIEELREKTLLNDQAETFYNKAITDENIQNPIKTNHNLQ